MFTFLACCGLDGETQSLIRLRDLIDQWRPDAVLFAGGLFRPPTSRESSTDDGDRHQFELTFLDSFLSLIGKHTKFAAVIPGPYDAPLSSFLRAGLHAQSQFPGIHVVHASLTTSGDVALAGIGGTVTATEDSGEPVVRCSRTTAEYFLQAFLLAEQSQKVLLFAEPPPGDFDGHPGNNIVGDLIDTCHPKLCVVCGPTNVRSARRVAHTTIVNPGRLSDGCAALIDWSAAVDNQVEMLQLSSSL
jgi:Icc-related predicted phosphoesterase